MELKNFSEKQTSCPRQDSAALCKHHYSHDCFTSSEYFGWWQPKSPLPEDTAEPAGLFYKKLPKWNMNRDIDLSNQTQCPDEMLGKSWHLNTDPVNSSVTRDILWDEENSGERVGSHLKSVTKLHISWGWFVSLLTQVLTGTMYPSSARPQILGSGRSKPEAGDGFTHSPCHPSGWHHSVNHACLLSKIC